jgi:hypothetical protein
MQRPKAVHAARHLPRADTGLHGDLCNSCALGDSGGVRKLVALIILVAALPTAAASASIWVTNNARAPVLRVDARGNAEVAWRDAGGQVRTLLVPRTGEVLPGGKIRGRDISRRQSNSQLPLAVVVRRTPDGRLWALQRWQVVPNGPLELRFARWTGEPTSVDAEVLNGRLVGTATYHQTPLYGFSPTTAGKRVRVAVLLDARDGASWRRLLGVFTRAPDGGFSVFLRPEWMSTAYRVTLRGPNLGWAYTPDTRSLVMYP